jgi:hypothetical protein
VRIGEQHPRREALAKSLARVLPMPIDREAREERRLLRRMDLKEAVKR